MIAMVDSPFHRSDWHGEIVSVDGTSIADFTEADLDAVLEYGDTGADWDGDCAGIARLKDGRYVAWESNWSPTGSGFAADAYGGEADIGVASTHDAARAYISERGRELLRAVQP